MISWQDGHGTHWTRHDNGEPFVSSPTYAPGPLEPFLDHSNRLQRAWRAARGAIDAEDQVVAMSALIAA